MSSKKVFPASLRDSKAIWEIRFHPQVNQLAITKKLVDFTTHHEWFKKKYFSSSVNRCFVLKINGLVKGYCRFDDFKDSLLVSIAIHPGYQGRGLGSFLLSGAMRLINNKRKILAEIKKGNQTSLKLFKKVGFKVYKTHGGVYHMKFVEPARKLRVAIVGAGRIGAVFDRPGDKNILTHAHAFCSHPGFSLVGFVDSNYKMAQEAAKIWGGKAYKTVAELFKHEAIDVVCVSTSDDSHFKILQSLKRYSIRGGLTEKPLTTDINDSAQLVGDKFFQHHPFVVNYSLRYTPELQKIKEEIVCGKYGAFITGNGSYGKGLLHNGSHLLDLLSFFGLLVKGFKITGQICDYSKKDPSISVLLSIKGGGLFNLQAISAVHYTLFEIDLFFSRARVRILNGGQEVEIFGVDEDKNFSGYRRLFLQKKQKTSRLRRSMYKAVDNLYQAIIKKERVVCTIKDACDVQKLCQRIRNRRVL